MVASNEPTPRPPRSRRRWLRVLGALATLVAVVLGAAACVLHHLDNPWVKRRLLAFARAASGLEVDYASIRVRELSGLHVEGLVVRTPAELATAAPELARIDALDVGWSPRSLLGGGPRIERVGVHGLQITIVVDERGRTSFDAIPAPPSPPSPPTPLSALPASIFASPLPVGRIDVDAVTVALVRTKEARIVERIDLRGLACALEATPGPGARLVIGSPGAPRELEILRVVDGATKRARIALEVGLAASARDASLALALDVVGQDLVDALPTGKILRVGAHAAFDPKAGRSSIELSRADIGDGVAAARAAIDLPDDGAPVVRHLEADVDVVRLLALAPAGMVPATVERGKVHAEIDALDVAAPGAQAKIGVDASIEGATLRAGDAEIALASLRAELHGKPGEGTAFGAEGEIAIEGLRVHTEGGDAGAPDLRVRVGAAHDSGGAWSGEASVDLDRLDATAFGVEAREVSLTARSRELRLDPKAIFGVRGDVDLELAAATIDARRAAGVLAEKLHLTLRAPLLAAPPLALEGSLEVARVALFDARGKPRLEDPLRVDFALRDVAPDLERPIATRAIAHVDVTVGATKAAIDATKTADAIDYRLHATATNLGDVGKLADAGQHRERWERMSLSLDSAGRVDRLADASPSLRQEAHLVVAEPSFGDFGARAIDVTLASAGTTARQEAKIAGRADALVVDGANLGEERLEATATFDARAASLRLDLTSAGPARLKVGATAALDRARGAVDYDVAIDLDKLAPLAPLASKVHALAGFDLGKLALKIASRGRALGVAKPESRTRPRDAFGLEASVDVDLHGVLWTHEDQSIAVDDGHLHAIVGGDEETHTVESHLDVDSMKVALGPHVIAVRTIRDTLKAKLDKKVEEGEVAIDQRVTIEEVRQDLAPMYPIGKVEAHVVAARDDDGVIRIAEIKVVNAAGGTTIGVSGGLELAEDRRRMSLRAEVKQDLARACTQRDLFVGSGGAALTVRVESADLSVFRTRAVVKLERANLALPGPGLKLTGVDGEVPVRLDLHLKKGGVELLRETEVNRYSMLRFSDQHPMLSRRSFVSVESIVTPAVTIAPFAANLEVAQNIVSLGQVELGVRGGRVTGQFIIDVEGEDSKVQTHLRASGVQSSHGEPFDGNAALVVSLGDRSVEGRAEILRIGRRHLLDLLDLQDPQRVDGSMNQIRRALSLGYPSHLRISFDHGFASASVSFAGIASLLSVDDIRGVPMGALVDKTVRSIWKPQHHPR